MLESFFLYVFLPVFLCFSYWLFISGLLGAFRMYQSRNWNAIKGEIVGGEILYKSFSGEYGNQGRTKLVKQIQYSYSVNGEKYTNNKTLASDSLFLSDFKPISKLAKKNRLTAEDERVLEEAKEKIDKSVGKPIMIYYDPNKPSRSCLDNRFNKGIFLPIGMGLFFGFLLTLFLVKIIAQ